MIRRLLPLLVMLACLGEPIPAAATPTIQHVVVIAMENHSRSQVIGTSSAPYMTSLARTYGEATQYQNLTHPSLPNYMAFTGGTTGGISTDCFPSGCSSGGASIFSQVTWRTWAQSMPKPCYKQNASGYYVAHHNPALYYRTLTGCTTYDVALPTTPQITAAFTFIVPNECDDMHSCSVATADNWLKGYLPKLLATSAYQAGTTAILVWWDENAKAVGGSEPFIVVSPYTHGVTYTQSINHYDTLHTIEQVLGVGCLANSCGQTNFAAAFGL